MFARLIIKARTLLILPLLIKESKLSNTKNKFNSLTYLFNDSQISSNVLLDFISSIHFLTNNSIPPAVNLLSKTKILLGQFDSFLATIAELYEPDNFWEIVKTN